MCTDTVIFMEVSSGIATVNQDQEVMKSRVIVATARLAIEFPVLQAPSA